MSKGRKKLERDAHAFRRAKRESRAREREEARLRNAAHSQGKVWAHFDMDGGPVRLNDLLIGEVRYRAGVLPLRAYVAWMVLCSMPIDRVHRLAQELLLELPRDDE